MIGLFILYRGKLYHTIDPATMITGGAPAPETDRKSAPEAAFSALSNSYRRSTHPPWHSRVSGSQLTLPTVWRRQVHSGSSLLSLTTHAHAQQASPRGAGGGKTKRSNRGSCRNQVRTVPGAVFSDTGCSPTVAIR